MKLSEKVTHEKLKNIVPPPTLIPGAEIDQNVTEGGVIKPESTKPITPKVRILKIGSQVLKAFDGFVGEKSIVYVAPPYMQYVEINGMRLVSLMPDAIIAKET